MFADAIDCIAHDLNESLTRQFSLDERLVVVSNLMTPDGKPSNYSMNKVVLTLVRLEKDAVMQSANANHANQHLNVSAYRPLHVNIVLLVSATFSDEKYSQALKLLSAVAVFFQSKPIIDVSNTPSLPKAINKLTVEMEDLSFSEMSHLWGLMGAKLQPSLLYKIRTVVVEPSSLLGSVHTIDTPITTLSTDK